MRVKIALLLTLLCSGGITYAGNENGGVWVGRQFRPEQCVKIVPGQHEFKRKLATILYDIKPQNGLFAVNGRILFNKTFIPDNVSHVELEVLLINKDDVCTRQLNLQTVVETYQARFFFQGRLHKQPEIRPNILHHSLQAVGIYKICTSL